MPTRGDLGRLSLADCVVLALRNSLDVRGVFLNRIVQRFALRVARYEFEPHAAVQLSSQARSGYHAYDRTRDEGGKQAGALTTSRRVPTGGQFGFVWSEAVGHNDWHYDPGYDSAWQLSLTQPLLRGGGLDPAGVRVATASLTFARIAEGQNLLSLKQSLTAVINGTIGAYRAYVQTLRQLDISQRSLDRAHELADTNRELIRAGRMAPMEAIQSDAEIANRELGVLQAQNTVESVRLALIQILNLDREATFQVVEEGRTTVRVPSVEEGLGLALLNRPDYLAAQRSVDAAKLSLAVAERNALWDLSVNGSVGRGLTDEGTWPRTLWKAGQFGRTDWQALLTLTIPLRDLTIEQSVVSARVAREQATLGVKRLETSIAIEVTNVVRDAEVKARQVELASRARQLTERKLEIEADKLRAGRTTNFQMVSFQSDVVNAQVAELDAIIAYLNALTRLDDVLGTTLQTWRIDVSPDDDAVSVVGTPTR